MLPRTEKPRMITTRRLGRIRSMVDKLQPSSGRSNNRKKALKLMSAWPCTALGHPVRRAQVPVVSFLVIDRNTAKDC